MLYIPIINVLPYYYYYRDCLIKRTWYVLPGFQWYVLEGVVPGRVRFAKRTHPAAVSLPTIPGMPGIGYVFGYSFPGIMYHLCILYKTYQVRFARAPVVRFGEGGSRNGTF